MEDASNPPPSIATTWKSVVLVASVNVLTAPTLVHNYLALVSNGTSTITIDGQLLPTEALRPTAGSLPAASTW